MVAWLADLAQQSRLHGYRDGGIPAGRAQIFPHYHELDFRASLLHVIGPYVESYGGRK